MRGEEGIGPETVDPIPPRTPGNLVVEGQGSAKGYGERLLIDDLLVLPPRGGSWASSAQTAPARRRFPHDHRRGAAGRRRAAYRRDGRSLAYVWIRSRDAL